MPHVAAIRGAHLAPGPPTALTNVSSTSTTLVVGWAAPTTGGALDTGSYTLQYRVHNTGSFTNIVIPYCSPYSGSFTTPNSSVWRVANGAVNANAPFINGVEDTDAFNIAILISMPDGNVWHRNTSGTWFFEANTSTATTHAWASNATPTVAPYTTGVTITGLTAGTQYDVNVFVTNLAGTSTLASGLFTPSGLTRNTVMTLYAGFETAAGTQQRVGFFTTVMGVAPISYGYAVNASHPLATWPGDAAGDINPANNNNVLYVPKLEINMQLSGDATSDITFQNIINDASHGNVWQTAIVGMINSYKNAGATLIYIAPGWEMNIGTSCQTTPSNAADYVAAWQKIAGWAHGVSGVTVKTIWAPNDGDFATSANKVNCGLIFPGTPAVDIVGIDIYGSPVDTDTLATRNYGTDFATASNTSGYSITTAFLFGQHYGLPVAFNETGAGAGNATWPANLQSAVTGFIHTYKTPVELIEFWDVVSGSFSLQWDNNGTPNATTNAWKSCWQAILAASQAP